MTGWEINLGLIPGVLFGVRQYDARENDRIDYVLYIGCIDIRFTAFSNEE